MRRSMGNTLFNRDGYPEDLLDRNSRQVYFIFLYDISIRCKRDNIKEKKNTVQEMAENQGEE